MQKPHHPLPDHQIHTLIKKKKCSREHYISKSTHTNTTITFAKSSWHLPSLSPTKPACLSCSSQSWWPSRATLLRLRSAPLRSTTSTCAPLSSCPVQPILSLAPNAAPLSVLSTTTASATLSASPPAFPPFATSLRSLAVRFSYLF